MKKMNKTDKSQENSSGFVFSQEALKVNSAKGTNTPFIAEINTHLKGNVWSKACNK